MYALRNEVRLIYTCYFHAEGKSVHQTQASTLSITVAACEIWQWFEMSFPCQSYLCGFTSNVFAVPLSRELSVSVDM